MGATPAHPTLVSASFASWRVDESNSLTAGADGLSFDLVSSFGGASADGSLLLSVGLVSVGSSTTLAKNRVRPPPELSLSSAAAKSGAMFLLYSSDDDDGDTEVLCVGRVNPRDEVMSSAEVDRISADDEDEVILLRL